MTWIYWGIGAAWAAAVVYEWMWSGQGALWLGYLLTGGVFMGAVVLMRQPWRRGVPKLKPRTWFTLAALACAFFMLAMDHTAEEGASHVPMLPLYLILFLDFLASGCYTWWKNRYPDP